MKEGIEMEPWLETVGVVFVSLMSIFVGRVISALRKPYWFLGFFIPFVLITVLVIARFHSELNFIRPFSWIVTSRVRFVILSLAISMGLTIPLSRLPRQWEKYLVCTLMVVFVIWSSVLPFLLPALLKGSLSNITTRFDKNGICRQTTRYTCGPAAAVTALGRLGLSADEGEIAILSHASPVAGTLPSQLCSALQSRYGANGLKCQYRRFESVEQLGRTGIILAVVKEAFFIDHCLVVLQVSENGIAVADPITGIRLIPQEQFEKIWRFSGIVMERDYLQSI